MTSSQTTVVYGIGGKKEIHSFPLIKDVLEKHYDSRLNRIADRDRVDEIYESFVNGENIQGVISVTFALVDGMRYLVDGQHRLEALKMYIDHHPDRELLLDRIHVHVREIEVLTRDEATKLHSEIGTTRPAEMVTSEQENDYLRCLDEFLHGCLNKPKKTESPNYGNWPDSFSRIVKNSGFFNYFDSPETMLREIRALNDCLFRLAVQTANPSVRKYITDGKVEKFKNKTYTSFSETYRLHPSGNVMCLYLIVRYGFMEIIIDKIFNHPAISYDRYLGLEKRLNFNDVPSEADKDETMNRFFGKPAPGRKCQKACPVCNVSLMDRDERSSFHFGHIRSRARGGKNDPSNLLPICPRCNLDCRARNLNEYCREKFGRDILI